MVDPSKVEVSPDGQWVYDGYQWWPIAQVPPGTQTAQGYVWDGQQWHPPAQQPEPQPAQPATVVNNTTVKKTGCIGGLLGLVGLVVIVLIFASMFSGGSDTASQPSGESAPSRPEPSYTYSQPEPSNTEPAPSETPSQMSSADAILAALNLTWEAKSEADQQAMCQAYKVDPGGAYAQFQSGAAQERTQGISRDDFDAFFSFKC